MQRKINLFFVLCLAADCMMAAPEQARRADDFVDMMGVNGHLPYDNTPYLDSYDSIIKPRVQELGIRHWRDALLQWERDVNRALELGELGVKFNVTTPTQEMKVIMPRIKALLPVLESVEGPNELDHGYRDGVCPPGQYCNTETYKGLSYPENVPAVQNDLYDTIKSDPETQHLNVVMAGFSYPDNTPTVGLVEGCDWGNTHSYPGGGSPLFRLDDWYIPRMRVNCGPDKPLCATETGYHNAINKNDGHWIQGVSERAAAKYHTRLFFEYFIRGFIRVFLYEFIDQHVAPDASEANFGLVRNDGTPKEQFHAIKNHIALLNDPGPGFEPQSLDFEVSGELDNVHHCLLQKRDGRFFLALWVDAVSFDLDAKTDLETEQDVTITLNTPIHKATAYTPAFSPDPGETYTDPAALQIKVPDHPLVLELEPVGMQTAIRTVSSEDLPLCKRGTWSVQAARYPYILFLNPRGKQKEIVDSKGRSIPFGSAESLPRGP